MSNLDNYDSSTYALEAIKFQRKSPLGIALTDVFDEVFQFKKKYDEEHVSNSGQERKARHDAVMNFCRTKMVPQFKAALQKHAGLIAKDVILTPPDKACGFFAVNTGLDDPTNSVKAQNLYIGEKSYQDTKQSPKFKELVSLSKNFDADKGRISSPNFGKGRKIYTTVYFDVGVAFFSSELLPNTEALTSEEIAAILMHEAGHIVSLVEHIGDLMYTGQYIANATNGILGKDPMAFVEENYEYLQSLIKDSIDDGVISGAHGSILSGALARVYTFRDKIKYNIFGNALWVLLGSTVDILLHVLILTNRHYSFTKLMLQKYLTGLSLHTIKGGMRAHKSNRDSKSGDDAYTDRNVFSIERQADEFVSRHGYSGYLASGLQKLIYFMETLTGTKGALVLNSELDNFAIKSILAVSAFFTKTQGLDLESFNLQYEDTLSRMERLLQNNMAAFKDLSMPKDIQARYIADTEMLKKVISKEKKKISRITESVIWKYLGLIHAGEVLYEAATTGRLSKDMEKMLEQIDSLTNNSLYYTSAKIRQLSK